jgi:hypothetical protein
MCNQQAGVRSNMLQQDLARLDPFLIEDLIIDQSDSGLARNLERSSNYNTLFSAA